VVAVVVTMEAVARARVDSEHPQGLAAEAAVRKRS